MSAELKNIIEAVLLVSDSPLSVARIQGLFERGSQPAADEVKEALRALQQDCEARGVELRKIGNGYRYQSRPKYADWIRKLHATRPPKLSRALLETLAIIAYRQPVTRGDIEEIRGVSVTPEIMRRLLERGWVAEVGVRDIPGHPALFATTADFLSYFDLESLKDLPPLTPEREFGEIAGELDTPLPPELLAALRDSAYRDTASAQIPTDADGAEQSAEVAPAVEGELPELPKLPESAESSEKPEPATTTEPPPPPPDEVDHDTVADAPTES